MGAIRCTHTHVQICMYIRIYLCTHICTHARAHDYKKEIVTKMSSTTKVLDSITWTYLNNVFLALSYIIFHVKLPLSAIFHVRETCIWYIMLQFFGFSRICPASPTDIWWPSIDLWWCWICETLHQTWTNSTLVTLTCKLWFMFFMKGLWGACCIPCTILLQPRSTEPTMPSCHLIRLPWYQ